jgi:hypothetical protein
MDYLEEEYEGVFCQLKEYKLEIEGYHTKLDQRELELDESVEIVELLAKELQRWKNMTRKLHQTPGNTKTDIDARSRLYNEVRMAPPTARQKSVYELADPMRGRPHIMLKITRALKVATTPV